MELTPKPEFGKIVKGPNRYDLMMALFEKKDVTFVIEHGDGLHEWKVAIEALAQDMASTMINRSFAVGVTRFTSDLWLISAWATCECKTHRRKYVGENHNRITMIYDCANRDGESSVLRGDFFTMKPYFELNKFWINQVQPTAL